MENGIKQKTLLDKNKIVKAVLLHLSCIPYDLQISKLDAYDFDKEAPSLIYSYLKNRKQTVLQASVFRALPFNIFLNDLYLFITKCRFLPTQMIILYQRTPLNSQENTCAGEYFLIKLPFLFLIKPQACNFIKKESIAQVFSCELCEISKNTFFTDTSGQLLLQTTN